MFGSPVQEQFINRPGPGRSPRAGGLILLVLALIGGFAYWAYRFEIEEVTRASGRVVPSSQLQMVQTLEGGIIRDIAVREGDIVEAGQLLLQIDDTSFQSRLGELEQQQAALQGQRARLQAEAEGADAPTFPPALTARAPQIAEAEAALFVSRRAQLQQELDILNRRILQRQSNLTENLALVRKLTAVVAPLREEMRLSENMLDRDVLPEIEVLRLRAQLAEKEGDLEINRAATDRLRNAVEEARQELTAAQSAFTLRAREALTEVRTRLAIVEETIKSASDQVSRTALRAPVRGVINTISVNTLGSVVQPGADIVSIVPLDDGLLIEADVSPRDVAFITPDSTASVKITAYDYLIYGALSARVDRISADAFTNQDGQTFFRIYLRTDETHLGSDETPYTIIPGMLAAVEIQTGRKTVLNYLAKPILRARAEALRER